MTTKRKPSHDDSLRLRELKKNTKRAEDVIGNLDYIDEIPPPPEASRTDVSLWG